MILWSPSVNINSDRGAARPPPSAAPAAAEINNLACERRRSRREIFFFSKKKEVNSRPFLHGWGESPYLRKSPIAQLTRQPSAPRRAPRVRASGRAWPVPAPSCFGRSGCGVSFHPLNPSPTGRR